MDEIKKLSIDLFNSILSFLSNNTQEILFNEIENMIEDINKYIEVIINYYSNNKYIFNYENYNEFCKNIKSNDINNIINMFSGTFFHTEYFLLKNLQTIIHYINQHNLYNNDPTTIINSVSVDIISNKPLCLVCDEIIDIIKEDIFKDLYNKENKITVTTNFSTYNANSSKYFDKANLSDEIISKFETINLYVGIKLNNNNFESNTITYKNNLNEASKHTFLRSIVKIKNLINFFITIDYFNREIIKNYNTSIIYSNNSSSNQQQFNNSSESNVKFSTNESSDPNQKLNNTILIDNNFISTSYSYNNELQKDNYEVDRSIYIKNYNTYVYYSYLSSIK